LKESDMTLTILDPRTGQQVTITVPDKPTGFVRM
jgi:hypothetical protein